MIIPAIRMPRAIIGKDFFILMSVRAAISAPVQPPVPGRGMATNKSRPQLGRDVRAACEALREPYRSVAVEYFCEDMPLSQIAERTGEPLKTIQTRAYRAKKMLRENLKEVILQ